MRRPATGEESKKRGRSYQYSNTFNLLGAGPWPRGHAGPGVEHVCAWLKNASLRWPAWRSNSDRDGDGGRHSLPNKLDQRSPLSSQSRSYPRCTSSHPQQLRKSTELFRQLGYPSHIAGEPQQAGIENKRGRAVVMLRLQSQLLAKSRFFSAAAEQTIYTGLFRNANVLTELESMYRESKKALGCLPPECEYRQSMEAVADERLALLAEPNVSRERFEGAVGEGLVEEVLQQASEELRLIEKMSAWQPWQSLEDPPPAGQWTTDAEGAR